MCSAPACKTLGSVAPIACTLEIESTNFWSDSQVTLYWLKRDPSTLATFVANRVSKILELSENVVWRHVPTSDHPDDLVSRGKTWTA